MDQENIRFVEARSNPHRPISSAEFYNLGIKDEVKHVVDLVELREDPPNIVISECLKDTEFIQNDSDKQKIFKKNSYVSSTSIYYQLHYTKTGMRILKPASIKFKNVYKPYKGQDLTNKTIFIWRTGGFGDLLFIKPLMEYIKKTYTNCKIQFACGPQFLPMVKTWDCIDELVNLPFHVRFLWKADYHVVFEGVIERCKEAETTNCYKLFAKWLELPVPVEDLIPKQTVQEESLNHCKQILKEWGLDEKSFILVQLRASSPIRTPSPKFWKSVIDTLTSKGYRIVLTDSSKYKDMLQGFISTLENKELVYNFSEYSKGMNATIAMASLCEACISTDTALAHIGVSVGTKVFGFYGPFPGYVRLETYPKNLCDWVDSKMFCVPCYKHGHLSCANSDKQGHSKCYEQIDVKEAVKKFEELLRR